MLERIRISNLAIVEEAEIALGPGLNVITGETGAGKSLLVQSVSLLVGERAPADSVREGADSAIVEGEFRLDPGPARRIAELLEEWGLPSDETLIVRREVLAGGRSRASVNQSPVTLANLKRLGATLADLHGQHEHQSLLDSDAGHEVLDRLGGLTGPRAHYEGALGAWRDATAALERLEQSLSQFADRREWLLEAARELDEAHLSVGEEEELKREAARLAHADRLRERVGLALERLSDGERPALESIRAAAHAVDQAAALDPSLAEVVGETLEEARIAAGEAARQLADYAAALEVDPASLDAIETRRERIARLTRKYRRTVSELLEWREELGRELATGEDADGTLARARERVAATEAEWAAAGGSLSRARRAAAREWSARIARELKPLGFARAHLEFLVVPPEEGASRFLAHGLERVEIAFTANPGEPARPLRRIASGGELSRVMLALKTALEAQDRVDVLLFDEVDSGIGGTVAQAVGERLKRLGRHRQIVCVTHLPMIAALASRHLRVTKRVTGGRSLARFEVLDEEERVEELARMLAGNLATPTTRRQARELLGPAATGAR